MKSRFRAGRGTIGALLAGGVAAALTLTAIVPASAEGMPSVSSNSANSTAAKVALHPDLDWAGSQIAKHVHFLPASTAIPATVTQTPGLDVSSYQGNVNWSSVKANGAKFAYIKATEGTYYTNPYFAQQYNGSYNVGIIRGSYHFATPNTTGGATQADYFVNHGGGWSADGMTLPGMVDLEWNPYGSACYGLSQSGMVNWVLSFSNEYHARTTRWPVIYTAQSWWQQCTGNLGAFASTNPLFVAYYSNWPGPMPYNWSYQTIWQYASSGTFPGDQDLFNGDYSRVQALAG